MRVQFPVLTRVRPSSGPLPRDHELNHVHFGPNLSVAYNVPGRCIALAAFDCEHIPTDFKWFQAPRASGNGRGIVKGSLRRLYWLVAPEVFLREAAGYSLICSNAMPTALDFICK